MKKKLFVILTIVTLLFSLIGCSREEETKTFNLEEVYQSVMALQADTGLEELVMLPESNAEYLDMFYPGFAAIERLQTVAYMAPVTGFATEIVLVELTSKEDVSAMKKIFEARIETGSDDSTYPETAIHWANRAQVHTYGNYVCMIVLPEGYIIPENVFQ